MFLFGIIFNVPCVGWSHTCRGGSGALYLKSAIAGVNSFPEGYSCVDCTAILDVLKNWSCAIRGCEPCQVGNQAALSGLSDVPQGCLFGADVAVTVCKDISTERCMALSNTWNHPRMRIFAYAFLLILGGKHVRL